MNFLDSFRVKITAKKMAARGLFPRFNEIIPTGFGFFSTLYDHEVDSIIGEDVSTGFGKSPEAALIRSISEYVERTAFRDGKVRGEQSCLTQRSDGLAAFPKILATKDHSYFCARRNAFNEAVERFSWATWWDNPEISQRVYDARFLKKFWAQSDIAIGEVPFHEKIVDLQIVMPSIHLKEVTLIIIVAFTADGGVISGGAAGGPTPLAMKSTITRAASELFRHALALKRMKDSGLPAKSFYQKRTAVAAGADSVLPKPMSRAHLFKLISSSLKMETSAAEQIQQVANENKAKPRIAYVDDAITFTLSWKFKLKDQIDIESFSSSTSFLKKTQDDPDFLQSLDVIVTDYYFGADDPLNGKSFAAKLRALGYEKPIYLASNGDFNEDDIKPDLSGVIGKDVPDFETVMSWIKA